VEIGGAGAGERGAGASAPPRRDTKMKVDLVLIDNNHMEMLITAESFVEEIALKAWAQEYWHEPAKTTASLVVRPYIGPAPKGHEDETCHSADHEQQRRNA